MPGEGGGGVSSLAGFHHGEVLIIIATAPDSSPDVREEPGLSMAIPVHFCFLRTLCLGMKQ